MRHKLDIPTIINPKQRVPQLQVLISEEKLVQFINENKRDLADLMNIFRVSKEVLIEHVSQELISSLAGFSSEHQKEQLAIEAADIAWSKKLKPKLIQVVYEDIVDQAISYTHRKHLEEVPFEDGAESRERLKSLVADVISLEKVMAHPIQLKLKPSYQILPEDLQGFLDRAYTETVRDIFQTLHYLEEPLETALYENYFNDTVPTKFSLDMLQRFHCGECDKEEIIEWALDRPDFWMQELLSNCNRNIDRDPNIAGDEKLTQKAAAYQLLKSIFLDNSSKDVH